MAYDHNKKAGNAGDVIKHVALIAALDSLRKDNDKLKFVDLFAGYAFNPIVAGNEWRDGIGRININPENVLNDAVRVYLNWYLSRPSLNGGIYPGSSLVAHDVLTHQGREIELTLFDISENPIKNLKLVFGGKQHHIYHRAANLNDSEIVTADFLFIDPPGLSSERNSSYPKLDELIQFTSLPKAAQILFWLPMTESIQTDAASIQTLVGCGFDITRVAWAGAGTTPGCVLAYKLSRGTVPRLRSAVEEIYAIAELGNDKGSYLEHVNA